ncbi:MAG: hypothetical protein Q8L48_16835 [Archangium sp.]|nr:hypothetical protein [Archangium sp.]
MARARQLSPGFFTDERIVSVSAFARLLFAGLWTEADREGRIEDKPLVLKMRLFPCDPVNIAELLGELVAAGLITRYRAAGASFLLVPRFKDHQRPHPKEAPSRLPAPPLTDEARELASCMEDEVNLGAEARENKPCMKVEPGKELHGRGVNPSDVQAFKPSGLQAFMPSADQPPAADFTGDGFFAWTQETRVDLGAVREAPPARGLGAWFSEAMMEVGGDLDRLKAGWLAYLKDPYWFPRKNPWAGWLKKWRECVPPKLPPGVPIGPLCRVCGSKGGCGSAEVPLCLAHWQEATEWCAGKRLDTWEEGVLAKWLDALAVELRA